jgi:hypothetical protein
MAALRSIVEISMNPDKCACCGATLSHASTHSKNGLSRVAPRPPSDGSPAPDGRVWALDIDGYGSIIFKGHLLEAIPLSRFRCEPGSERTRGHLSALTAHCASFRKHLI